MQSLRALAEGKTDGITKSTTFRVDPDLIKFELGFNLRDENDELEAHIERLYLAMKQGAFIPPVDVHVSDTGEVIARDGHCRTKAAQRIKLELPEFTLECRQLRGNDTDAIFHMLGTGGGGLPLTPLQQGRGFLRLINMGFNCSQIAVKLGVTPATVSNGLVLAEAPQAVQTMIANGEVSSTTAREAVMNGKNGVAALTEAVEKQRKAVKPKKGKKPRKVTARHLKNTAAAKPDKKAPAGHVSITIPKESAQAALEVIQTFVADDDKLKPIATALETALM